MTSCSSMFLFLLSVVSANRYCALSESHVVCKFEPCAMKSVKCGEIYYELPLNKEERKHIVYLHNFYRDHLSLVVPDFFPNLRRAENMNLVGYDSELEFIARCHANNCNAFSLRDEYRGTKIFKNVGQNVFIFKTPTAVQKKIFFDLAVQEWATEFGNIYLSDTDKLQFANNSACLNGAQLIQAETKRIGCARVVYSKQNKEYMMVVCNYAPGLVDGEQLYSAGDYCKKCKCDKKFPSLCYNPPIIDDFLSPFKILGADSIDARSNSHKAGVVHFILIILIAFSIEV